MLYLCLNFMIRNSLTLSVMIYKVASEHCSATIFFSCSLYSTLMYYIIGHKEVAEDAVHSKGKKERKKVG